MYVSIRNHPAALISETSSSTSSFSLVSLPVGISYQQHPSISGLANFCTYIPDCAQIPVYRDPIFATIMHSDVSEASFLVTLSFLFKVRSACTA